MPNTLILHGLLRNNVEKLDQAPAHEMIRCKTMTALVSTAYVSSDNPEPGPEEWASAALIHHRILVSYCAQYTVLPMRFGTFFSEADAVRQAVAGRANAYLDALSALSGLQEYIVQLTGTVRQEPVPITSVSGRDFLTIRKSVRNQRQSGQNRRQAFLRTLQDRLAEISTHPNCMRQPKPERLLDASILIPVTQATRLSALIVEQGQMAETLGLELSVTGPCPAYSFSLTPELDEETCDGA